MQESVPARSNWRSTLFSLIAMGIFDDAIRQHLDLKRQHGAAESELQQLEDEAFGPPTRPDEPDFPEPAAGTEHSGNGNGGPLSSDQGEPVGDLAAGEEDAPRAEAPAAEHPIVDEPPESSEAEAAAEAPTTFFDHTSDDEESPDQEPSSSDDTEPPTGEDATAASAPPDEEIASQPPSADEPPVESLDTVEHPAPFDTIEADAEVAQVPEDEHAEEDRHAEEAQEDEELVEEDAGLEDEEPEGELSEDGEADDESDDVLADTPEFLKDAPEDDELWFEQGKPKDFDF